MNVWRKAVSVAAVSPCVAAAFVLAPSAAAAPAEVSAAAPLARTVTFVRTVYCSPVGLHNAAVVKVAFSRTYYPRRTVVTLHWVQPVSGRNTLGRAVTRSEFNVGERNGQTSPFVAALTAPNKVIVVWKWRPSAMQNGCSARFA